MAEKFVIKGGKQLKGEIEVKGAKNSALPILAATILTDDPCVIGNLPLIQDVFRMLEAIESLGASITWLGERKVKIDARGVEADNIPFEAIARFRGSVLLLGSLLARFNKVEIPPPGGCLIGARPLDTHLDAFSQLGVGSEAKEGIFSFKKAELPEDSFETLEFFKRKQKEKNLKEVVLKEFSVTATENVLLYSSLGKKKILLKITDQDYQVQELIEVLRQMGAEIEIKKCHVIEIQGNEKLKGFNYTIKPDPIETGTLMVAALATKGEVVIKNAALSFLDLFLKRLYDSGARFKITKEDELKVFPSRGLRIDKIQSLPYPGIHSDLQPELGVLATQSKGSTLIHDPLYEGRLKYLEELNKMGADIIFCDPHRAIISGPTPLRGVEIPSLDLRAGAALIIAGLIAEGETIINNIYQISRGYEEIAERLRSLGADIKEI
jgi:UDP-N-acetylglucosamine 1-carboxyvinyltransferase